MALYDVSTTEKKANPELLSGRGNIDEIKAVIPSDASASNKLVAQYTPRSEYSINNSSSNDTWYKVGRYTGGNRSSRLDLISDRVDGQTFESSIRISGAGTNANYVSWIGEDGCENSVNAVQIDSSYNLYIKLMSYSAVRIIAYGNFESFDYEALQSSPSGSNIPLQKLVTESDLTPIIKTATPTAQFVSGSIRYTKSGNVCTISIRELAVNTSESNRLICTGLPLPTDPIFFGCVINGVYYTMNINEDGSLRDANNTAFGNKSGLYGSVTYVCQ